MFTEKIECFDLAQIRDSGQCFRMDEKDGVYSVIASGRYLEMTQERDEVIFSCEREEFDSFWKSYFDLGTDYAVYMDKIKPDDKYLRNAAQFGSGIRILRQDLWEMIVTFLISQQNNIVRIRKCVDNLCRTYGEEKVNFRGEVYYSFPSPEAFCDLPEDALKECNLGYRSKYVVRTAKMAADGQIDLDAVRKMPYKTAREELLGLFGVGGKVADCICLFGLHHLDAFPVDTHIQQALDRNYKKGFPKRPYKGFRGILQQYIFYWELKGR